MVILPKIDDFLVCLADTFYFIICASVLIKIYIPAFRRHDFGKVV